MTEPVMIGRNLAANLKALLRSNGQEYVNNKTGPRSRTAKYGAGRGQSYNPIVEVVSATPVDGYYPAKWVLSDGAGGFEQKGDCWAVDLNGGMLATSYYHGKLYEIHDDGTAIFRVNSADELVKVTANDTTPGYLKDKLSAGTGITLTEINDGGNETLQITASGGGGADEKAKVSSGDTTTDYLQNKLAAGTKITITKQNAGSNETLRFDCTANYPTFSGCIATRTSQTIPDSSEDPILFTTEVEDTDGYHSTSTNTDRFNVPTAGRYMVILHVTFAGNATGYRYASIYHSSLTLDSGVQVPNNGASDTVGIEVVTRSPFVSSGSYFYATVEQTSGGDLSMVKARLEIHRIE